MAQAMVTVEELNKSYGSHKVIDALSFTIQEGERMAVFAPSGAGKTTLIKILAGLEKPDSGRVFLADPNPVTVFQEPRLFPFLTITENILLPYKIQNRSITSEVQRRFDSWVELCDLGDFIHHYPYQLSGGMRQKVALIRGLLGQPRFIMLDEPFQSINYAAKQAIISHIIKSMPGLSLLFVTHIAEEIPLLAQTVLFFTNSCLAHPERVKAELLQGKLLISSPIFIHDENNGTFPQDV
jgi:NitT/TauT family transport system ATP-binding protein